MEGATEDSLLPSFSCVTLPFELVSVSTRSGLAFKVGDELSSFDFVSFTAFLGSLFLSWSPDFLSHILEESEELTFLKKVLVSLDCLILSFISFLHNSTGTK